MIKSIVFYSWEQGYLEEKVVAEGIQEATKDLNVFIENNRVEIISINTNLIKDTCDDGYYLYDVWITVFYK